MNYRDFNDNELVSYIREDSEESQIIIFEKYKPLINKTATKMYKGCFNCGFEKDDLIQEGMLGLDAAIKTFSESKEASFYTYAKTIIERKMISLIVASRRQKNKILNESISLDADDEGNNNSVKFAKDSSTNPEFIMMDNIDEANFLNRAKDKLTSFEEQVFMLKVNHFDYKEIALMLGKNPKAIDNALQRIKTKIKEDVN